MNRHELSGAHIFMLQEQIKDEIKGMIKLIDKVYSKFFDIVESKFTANPHGCSKYLYI